MIYLVLYLIVALVVAGVFGSEIGSSSIGILAGLFWPITLTWFTIVYWAQRK